MSQLLDALKEPKVRLWYAERAFEHGWSRSVLSMHIERKLHARQGKALTNFTQTLPPPESDMAAQLFNDPYLFDMASQADSERQGIRHEVPNSRTKYRIRGSSN